MSTIEKELLAATGVSRGAKDSDQQYRVAVAKAAAKLPEDAWDTLSDSAQSWVNNATASINSSLKVAKAAKTDPEYDVADFSEETAEPDEEPASEADEPTSTEGEAEEAAPAEETENEEEPAVEKSPKSKKPAKAAKAAKAAKEPKATKPAKAPKEPKERKPSYSERLRQICIENRDLRDVEIAALAKKDPLTKDVSLPTLRGVYQAVRGTLKSLEALGYVVRKK